MLKRKVNQIIYLGVALALVPTLAAAPVTALAQQNSDNSSSNGTTNLGTLVVAPQNAPNNASSPKPNLRVHRHSLRLNIGQSLAPQPTPQPTSTGTYKPSPEQERQQEQQQEQEQDQEQQAMVHTQPSPLHIVQPQYPAIAYKSRLQGTVTLRFTIGAGGSTSHIRVIGSHPPGIFDDAARAAVKQWLFQPATVNGRPVSENVSQTLVFRPPTHTSHAPHQTVSNTTSNAGKPPADSVPGNIKPVHLVPPQYPSAAYRRNEGGSVTVSFLVKPNGHTSHIDVLYSKPRHTFDNAATDAVRQWRFKPVSKPTRVVQTITFTPPN